MVINIKTLDRKVFRIALNEESERQTMNQNMLKSQIKQGTRFDGDEDVISEIDRLKESFKKISHKRKDIIEISDEEFKFLKRLVKNQTIISNSRIQDWIPDGVNATEEKFEACRLDIIKYDEDLKICMQELANILGIEYNPNLK